MEPNNATEKQAGSLIFHILQLSNDIFQAVKLSIPAEWLSTDMTVAQLRVMVFLYTEEPSRMSAIASTLGTTLSTVTGTVEHLVKKELVERGDDPEDRRLVICKLSPLGQEIINLVWALGRQQMERLLKGLSLEELKKADEVAGIILRNALKTTKS